MSNEFKDITNVLEEAHRSEFEKLEKKLRLVNASQIKNFRKSLRSNDLSVDMYLLSNNSPLVLHQPETFYYDFDEDNSFRFYFSEHEPFYLSNIEYREFVPAVFNSFDFFESFLQDNYLNEDGALQMIGPDIDERLVRGPIKNSPLDDILINQVQGVPSVDDYGNPLFKITRFDLYDRTKPIFFRHPQSLNQKGVYGPN